MSHKAWIPITKTARVAIILQLCLAFTLLIRILSYPFIEELYEHKSRTLLYNEVMGNSVSFKGSGREISADLDRKLERNKLRFQALPEALQLRLIQKYDGMQSVADRSFFSKLKRSLEVTFFEVPFFKQCWLLLAIVIPLCVLLQKERAKLTMWILPILALAYASNNFFYGAVSNEKDADARFFPSEEVIVRDYLKEPLEPSITKQQQQLKKGWKVYLIREWANQEPATNSHKFELQAEQGEFAFNVARLTMQALSDNPIESPFKQKESPFLLVGYILWNAMLAWSSSRRRNDKIILSNT